MNLGLIIPYRNRLENLKISLPIIKKNLDISQINYEIAIINQDDNKLY